MADYKPDQWYSGVVTKWIPFKPSETEGKKGQGGFGFISCDGFPVCWFHASQVPVALQNTGVKVNVLVIPNPRDPGKWKAEEVQEAA